MSDWLVGIDIGGTKVAFVLADTSGDIRARWRRPTQSQGDPDADLERMAADVERLLSEQGAGPADLAAIGVSVPGPFDPARGVLQNPPNLPGWHEVPVRDRLSGALGGVRVALENDANAAALAEWRFGAGQGHDPLVYLTMSTGVGGGIVHEGAVLHGATCGAGELGHVPVAWPGEPCSCGLTGCLEAYTGGAAWSRRLQRLAAEVPEAARVAELAAADGRPPRPEHLVAAAREGDPFACAEFERWTDYLARGVAQIVFTLDPGRIVLGTIAVAAGEALCFEPLRRKVRARVWPRYAERLDVAPASLGGDLPYRAALCVALGALAS